LQNATKFDISTPEETKEAEVFGIVACQRERAEICPLPCPHLSAGEMKFETATPRPGETEGAGGPKQFISLFVFLRVSVVKLLPFGCGSVALRYFSGICSLKSVRGSK
jgi:hypothetical protein